MGLGAGRGLIRKSGPGALPAARRGVGERAYPAGVPRSQAEHGAAQPGHAVQDGVAWSLRGSLG